MEHWASEHLNKTPVSTKVKDLGRQAAKVNWHSCPIVNVYCSLVRDVKNKGACQCQGRAVGMPIQ